MRVPSGFVANAGGGAIQSHEIVALTLAHDAVLAILEWWPKDRDTYAGLLRCFPAALLHRFA